MRIDTIAAYVFKADLYCGPCVVLEKIEDIDIPGIKDKALNPEVSVEEMLDLIALELGIDRGVEYEFDSGEFPKTAFKDFMREDDNCVRCDERLA